MILLRITKHCLAYNSDVVKILYIDQNVYCLMLSQVLKVVLITEGAEVLRFQFCIKSLI